MKSIQFVAAVGVLITLSHYVLMSSAQQGGQGNLGGWGGGAGGAGASTWSSDNGQPGVNGNRQTSYSYGSVDANGVPYAGYGGNGGYHINVTDDQGRHHSYSGGQGIYGSSAGQPGQHGQSGYGRGFVSSSSTTAYAVAWSPFYIICLFSLFLLIKS